MKSADDIIYALFAAMDSCQVPENKRGPVAMTLATICAMDDDLDEEGFVAVARSSYRKAASLVLADEAERSKS